MPATLAILTAVFPPDERPRAIAIWVSNIVSSPRGTRHLSLNEVVDGDGDRATMRSYYLVVATNDAPPAIGATGGYDDHLVRLDGHWRFTRRVHTVDASFGGDALG